MRSKMENADNEIGFEVLSKQSSASRTRVEEDYKIIDENAEKKTASNEQHIEDPGIKKLSEG